MKKQTLKVLSYNIHKGFSTGNRSFQLRRMRDAIRLVKADLVFLQEVLGHHENHRQTIQEWPLQPQFEFLADEIWPHYAYGKNAVYAEGHHGNAILSKYPIIFSENLNISTNRFERRGLLHVEVQIPETGLSIHAICLHLGLFESGRRQQIHQLCRRISSHVPSDAALVIGGDFNDWRAKASSVLKKELGLHETYSSLHGKHARTFPSWLPTLQLDRIYARGWNIRRAQCLTGSPWNELSDHAAIYAEFEEP